MSAVKMLLSGEYGPEPGECPIGYLIPGNRKAYIVPHEYRAQLALITAARQEINRYVPRTIDLYFCHSAKVEGLAGALDETLKLLASPPGIVLEYHADWLYSVLTHEDVLREHEEFEERERNRG
jgi:hypothetical protein